LYSKTVGGGNEKQNAITASKMKKKKTSNEDIKGGK
jgi:hypothetical protein